MPTMAADSSLLQLEELLGDPATASAGAAACRIISNSSSSHDDVIGASSLPTERASRAAAMEAAAQAARLSERCRLLLPLMKQAAESSASNNRSEGQEVHESSPASRTSVNASCSKEACSKGGRGTAAAGIGKAPPPMAQLLELDCDKEEGPVIELEVGVGILDVNGQVPTDARLAEMGVQVVDLPDDSPVLQNPAASTTPPLDALQRVLAVRRQPNCNGQRPVVVSVLSSGSSSESEEDGNEDPNEQP